MSIFWVGDDPKYVNRFLGIWKEDRFHGISKASQGEEQRNIVWTTGYSRGFREAEGLDIWSSIDPKVKKMNVEKYLKKHHKTGKLDTEMPKMKPELETGYHASSSDSSTSAESSS